MATVYRYYKLNVRSPKLQRRRSKFCLLDFLAGIKYSVPEIGEKAEPLPDIMVRLREIPRTATFAWSPGTGSPYIATGTRAGAVDAEFSNDTQLELWDLNLSSNKHGHELQPAASIDTDSR